MCTSIIIRLWPAKSSMYIKIVICLLALWKNQWQKEVTSSLPDVTPSTRRTSVFPHQRSQKQAQLTNAPPSNCLEVYFIISFCVYENLDILNEYFTEIALLCVTGDTSRLIQEGPPSGPSRARLPDLNSLYCF